MLIQVNKYSDPSQHVTVDVEDECPACEAIRVGGCIEGIIFLESIRLADGVEVRTIHRCEVEHIVGVCVVKCEVVTAQVADAELVRFSAALSVAHTYPGMRKG